MIDTGSPAYQSGNKQGVTVLDYLAESCTPVTYSRLVEVAYHIAEAMIERRKFLMNQP